MSRGAEHLVHDYTINTGVTAKQNHSDRSCLIFTTTRQVTRATHVRNRVCPRVELILKIIILLLIIFLGFIKSKPCQSQTIKVKKILFPARGLNPDRCTPQQRLRAELFALRYPAEWVIPVPIQLFICRRAVIDCGGPGDCGLLFFRV